MPFVAGISASVGLVLLASREAEGGTAATYEVVLGRRTVEICL